MKITNYSNLPDVLVRACAGFEQKPVEDVIRVTSLIDSPYIRAMVLENWDSLEDDLESRVWSIFGTAVHNLIEKFALPDEGMHEHWTSSVIDRQVIAGTLDQFSKGIIRDWKTTSVWSVIYGNPRWELQLNVYAYLMRLNGHQVDGLEIVAFLKDWSRSKARLDPAYPQSPVVTVAIDLWPLEKQAEYIRERIKLHRQGKDYICTPEDRWQKPTTYAVIKIGNKRATKVCDSMDQAEEFRLNQKDADKFDIVTREGVDSRCAEYCQVRAICTQKKQIQEDSENVA